MAIGKFSPQKPANVLLVEDNLGDIRLMQEALRDTGSLIHVTRDGEQALKFLRQESPYQKAPRPEMVLLDLNLPRKGGREVLASVKEDPLLRHIPILVLSTSTSEEDIGRAYALHANCYIPKALDMEALAQISKLIETWLCTVILPAA